VPGASAAEAFHAATAVSRGSGATITAASTVGGHLYDYGTTRDTLADFRAALRSLSPPSTCAVR